MSYKPQNFETEKEHEVKNILGGFVFIVFLISLAVNSYAGELLLGAVGKSKYQIVIPDKYPDDKLAASVKQAAELHEEGFQ